MTIVTQLSLIVIHAIKKVHNATAAKVHIEHQIRIKHNVCVQTSILKMIHSSAPCVTITKYVEYVNLLRAVMHATLKKIGKKTQSMVHANVKKDILTI